MSREIVASRITSARVFGIGDDSEENDVIIRVTSVDGEKNYLIARDEFQRLAEQFSRDAALLTAKAGGRAN